MSNFVFLQKYMKLQEKVMYDEVTELGFATIGYCGADKSVYWNLALTDQLLKASELGVIEAKFSGLNRKSSIYFENTPGLNLLAEFLVKSGYKGSWEDSWQFWEGDEPSASEVMVKKVENKDDLKMFLDTFDKSYRKDDPQNPYGELGNYLQLSEESWLRLHESNREEYFVAFKAYKPVAVATLVNYGGIGYICNVGSLMEVRGQGYGKAVTLFCVNQSIKNGNNLHCLATEEGAYPNEFYKRIGFKTKFTAVGYTKE